MIESRLQVLIPTSGFGSRLGEISEYTNKSLARVGTKAVLSHIIEAYPEDSQFYIMLGHKGELVKEYVSLAHPNLHVYYLDLEMREGNLGLVEAIRSQIEHLSRARPLVFHASDTITELPPDFLDWKANIVLGHPTGTDTSLYRTVRPGGSMVPGGTKHPRVACILEKGEINMRGDLVHIGVVKFQDLNAFRDALESCRPNDCDTHVVSAMVKSYGSNPQFWLMETATWFDTGNSSSYQKTCEHFAEPGFVCLEKNDQMVYIVGDRIVKFFSDPGMVSRRLLRAEKIGDALPDMIGSTDHFFAYEKADGVLARDVMYPAQFSRFLDWCQTRLWKDPPENTADFPRQAHLFYWDKTIARLRAFYQKTGLEDKTDVINGETVPPLEEMLEKIDWKNVFNGIPSKSFHGDLHFSNVLIGPADQFKLIDWREGFGDTTEYGDVYYDLGKILHGLLVSHDVVEQGGFIVNIEDGPVRTVELDILRHNRHVECEAVFKQWAFLHDYDWGTVHFMCALVYLNIAVLHHHSYDRFLYFLGKRMIFDLLS